MSGVNTMSMNWAWEMEDEIDLAKLREEKGNKIGDVSNEKQKVDIDNSYSKPIGRFGEIEFKPQEDMELSNVISKKDYEVLGSEVDNRITEEDKKLVKTHYERKIEKLRPGRISNSETDEIIVSADGMTLTEFLEKPWLRKKKSLREIKLEKEIEAKEESYNKKLEDPLYAKSAVRLIRQQERRKKNNLSRSRKDLSGKRKGGKYSSKELSSNQKELLKSLGMTHKELLNKVGLDSRLTDTQKANLLSQGYFGKNESVTGLPMKRKYNSIGDKDILEFLYRFGVASITELSIAMDKHVNTITGQLNKMYQMGQIEKIPLGGIKYVYGITRIGQALITRDDRVPSYPSVKGMSQALTINYIASCLYKNKINALLLDDFPYYGREKDGELVKGEEIIPEKIFKLSMNSKLREMGYVKTIGTKVLPLISGPLKDEVEIIWRKWEMEGKVDLAPDTIEGNEFLYILYPDGLFNESYVVPDLVIKRPRNTDGSPNNIAIEVEKEVKSKDRYRKKLLAYKQDKRVYGRVIYVTDNKHVARKLKEVVDEIGLDNFDIVPFFDKDGNAMKVEDPWLL